MTILWIFYISQPTSRTLSVAAQSSPLQSLPKTLKVFIYIFHPWTTIPITTTTTTHQTLFIIWLKCLHHLQFGCICHLVGSCLSYRPSCLNTFWVEQNSCGGLWFPWCKIYQTLEFSKVSVESLSQYLLQTLEIDVWILQKVWNTCNLEKKKSRCWESFPKPALNIWFDFFFFCIGPMGEEACVGWIHNIWIKYYSKSPQIKQV